MPLKNKRDTILSGFTYIPSIYASNPQDYRVARVNNLCALLDSGLYIPKVWASPNFQVAAYGSTPFDIAMVQNTVVYAFRTSASTNGILTFKLTLPEGYPLTHNDYISGDLTDSYGNPCLNSSAGSSVSASRIPYYLLPKPLIVPSGHMNVEISNATAEATSVQVVLFTAEPLAPAIGELRKYCEPVGRSL